MVFFLNKEKFFIISKTQTFLQNKCRMDIAGLMNRCYKHAIMIGTYLRQTIHKITKRSARLIQIAYKKFAVTKIHQKCTRRELKWNRKSYGKSFSINCFILFFYKNLVLRAFLLNVAFRTTF